MNRRTVAWMNRRQKRKLAMYVAAYGVTDAYYARIGLPLRFVKAHRNWQRKVMDRQVKAEPALMPAAPRRRFNSAGYGRLVG